MRINWFSPLPPARTDIAHYTARILPALQEVVDVWAYTTQARVDLSGTHVRQYGPDSCDWAELNAGVSVYNIGNDSSFHSEIWNISRTHAGIVILHDLALQHLFAGYFLNTLKQPDLYLEIMQQEYGAPGLAAASSFIGGARTTDDVARDYPLTGIAIRDVLSVVVHTAAGFNAVRNITPAPVYHLPLPYQASPSGVFERWESLRNAGRTGRRHLVVFGYLGPNRRIDAILEALAGLPERGSFVLDIYGNVWNPDHVRSKAAALGVDDLVRLHGYVDDLDDKLAVADLALNLRYPTMGEASGTQLRIWDHALPSIVTQTGWYAELPDNVVCHVRPGSEVEDLQRHLRAFLRDPGPFRAQGTHGRETLIRRHSPQAYAAAIADIAVNSEWFSSSVMSLRAADRVGEELQRWLPRDAALCTHRIIDELAVLASPFEEKVNSVYDHP